MPSTIQIAAADGADGAADGGLWWWLCDFSRGVGGGVPCTFHEQRFACTCSYMCDVKLGSSVKACILNSRLFFYKKEKKEKEKCVYEHN